MRQLLFLPLLCLLCLPPPATDGTFPPAVVRADEPKKDDKKSPAPAAPYVKLPASVSGDPGDFIEIAADTNGSKVAWRVVDSGLKMFPISRLKDTTTAVVTGRNPGTYRVWAVTALAGEPSEIAECVVTINGTPVPPVPPVPPPTDPLVQAFQNAFNADTDPAKAANVKKLASLYRVAATSASGGVLDPSLVSYSDLLAKLHAAAGALGVPDNGVQKVRAAIAAEGDAVLGIGSASGAAKPINRDLTAKEFLKIAAALEAVK